MSDQTNEQTPDSEGENPEPAADDHSQPVPTDGGENLDDTRNDALYDVTLELRAILGSANMEVSNLLKLGRGAIIELDQKVKEDVTLFAAGKLIAYGQVVVVNDKIAVKISRLARPGTN